MRESPLLAGVVAVLLASVAGCASSLQLAGPSAAKAAAPGSLRDDLGGSPADLLPIPDGPRADADAAATAPPRSSGVSEAESPVFASLLATRDEQDSGAMLVQFDRLDQFDEDVLSPSPLLPPLAPEANAWFESRPLLSDLLGNVLTDQVNYYSPHSLGMLAIGTGVAAVVANGPLDEAIRRNYQEDYRDLRTDEFSEAFHTSKILGNGYVTIPAYCGAARSAAGSMRRPSATSRASGAGVACGPSWSGGRRCWPCRC